MLGCSDVFQQMLLSARIGCDLVEDWELVPIVVNSIRSNLLLNTMVRCECLVMIIVKLVRAGCKHVLLLELHLILRRALRSKKAGTA